jgi:hypothetical protein
VAIDDNQRKMVHDQIKITMQITIGVTLIAVGASIHLTSISFINTNAALFFGLFVSFIVYLAIGLTLLAKGLHKAKMEYGASPKQSDATHPTTPANIGTIGIRDLIQVDATVIAGALILLTIASLNPSIPSGLDLFLVRFAAGVIVTPFALSAAVLVFATEQNARTSLIIGKALTVTGFAVLIYSMFAYIYASRPL